MKSGEALQIGGGNIGRALIGPLMHEAGLHVTFADVNQGLVDDINRYKNYPVTIVSSTGRREQVVDDISAVSAQDESAMIDRIVSADVITTAVGVGVLSKLAPVLTRGLMERVKRRPKEEMHVMLVACENVAQNTELLKQHVLNELPDDEWRRKIESTVSFPNCAVDRIVPNTADASGHPLSVMTEEYYQLTLDGTALKSEMPLIPGIALTDNLADILTQKLYTLNGSHAAVAYWGYLKGYETIDQAVLDNDIATLTNGFMSEVSAVVLQTCRSITAEQQAAFTEATMKRFGNPFLNDDVKRVGRDPLRKLASGDRLLKPAAVATHLGIAIPHLGYAVLGGLKFDNPSDPQAVELQSSIRDNGIEATVVALCGLQKAHPLLYQLTAGYGFTQLL